MKVIVDANMVFSGILNTNGKVGEMLINSYKLIDFMAPDFLRVEIRKHHKRLVELSKLSLEEVVEAEYLVCKDIKFISEEQVSDENWQAAFELVQDIDSNDVPYVAFSKQFKRKIWTGDRKLIRGLERKGFKNTITTEALSLIREELRKSKLRRGR